VAFTLSIHSAGMFTQQRLNLNFCHAKWEMQKITVFWKTIFDMDTSSSVWNGNPQQLKNTISNPNCNNKNGGFWTNTSTNLDLIPGRRLSTPWRPHWLWTLLCILAIECQELFFAEKVARLWGWSHLDLGWRLRMCGIYPPLSFLTWCPSTENFISVVPI
jgi:hypothetical protein